MLFEFVPGLARRERWSYEQDVWKGYSVTGDIIRI